MFLCVHLCSVDRNFNVGMLERYSDLEWPRIEAVAHVKLTKWDDMGMEWRA